MDPCSTAGLVRQMHKEEVWETDENVLESQDVCLELRLMLGVGVCNGALSLVLPDILGVLQNEVLVARNDVLEMVSLVSSVKRLPEADDARGSRTGIPSGNVQVVSPEGGTNT
jgi:hypothetical protein